MPRPKKNRIVKQPPLYCGFKPLGIPANRLEKINMSLDEFEAIRLADFVGMEHAEAAEEMEISRSTFTRLIEKSRKKLAEFMITGKMLTIEGGNIHFKGNLIKCSDCGHMFNMNFQTDITKCPCCNSSNLIDLAGSFGHGKCCRNRRNK